jgi:hypothetical protein
MKAARTSPAPVPSHGSPLLRRTLPATDPPPYDGKPDRPALQLALRAGLWAALGIGCVGGTVALAGGREEPPTVPEAPVAEEWSVPGPATGVAEDTVGRWLAASEEERTELAGLFVEPPPTVDDAGGRLEPVGTGGGRDGSGGGVTVTRVRAVAGERLQDGYWSVTVAAEVRLPEDDPAPATTAPADEADGIEDGGGGEGDDRTTTWFVEVGIVGDSNAGFVALAAPAIVPPPPVGESTWGLAGERRTVEEDDPLAQLIERFLGAVLAGDGDPSPYLAPGAEIGPADPAPFTDVVVVDLATEELDEGRTWVLAHVVAVTADGARLPLSYDVTVVERVDRWEVEALGGVPTFIE